MQNSWHCIIDDRIEEVVDVISRVRCRYQNKGIELAKQQGKYKGRKQKLSSFEINAIKEKLGAGVPKTRVAKDFNITRATLYSYLSPESGNGTWGQIGIGKVQKGIIR